MSKRHFIKATLLGGLVCLSLLAHAQDNAFKVGLILPMSGPFASTGKQLESAARLYVAQHGDTVAGRKVVLIVKDDGGAPEVTKRIAQELVVNDKVQVLAGFGLTPLAMATAPVATQSNTHGGHGGSNFHCDGSFSLHCSHQFYCASSGGHLGRLGFQK